jgi:hypothetical protein
MSGKKYHQHVPAKTDADGWIKKRRMTYEFPPVNHATRASLMPKVSIDVKCEQNDTDKYDFAQVNHKRADDFNVYKRNSVAEVTPAKDMGGVQNPYMCMETEKSPNRQLVKVKPVERDLSLQEIKKNNTLFYTYDPRGNKTKPLPKGYCSSCLCPQIYCAETIFGNMTEHHALTKVCCSGSTYDTEKK